MVPKRIIIHHEDLVNLISVVLNEIEDDRLYEDDGVNDTQTEIRYDSESDIVRVSVIAVCGLATYFVGLYSTEYILRVVDRFFLQKTTNPNNS